MVVGLQCSEFEIVELWSRGSVVHWVSGLSLSSTPLKAPTINTLPQKPTTNFWNVKIFKIDFKTNNFYNLESARFVVVLNQVIFLQAGKSQRKFGEKKQFI